MSGLGDALVGSFYLAPVQFYTKLLRYDVLKVERYEHYIKQTYRNRCIIAAASGPLALTIPVEKGEKDKVLMKDVRISSHGHWQHVHWQAIVSAYRQSPFFEFYADELRPFYEKQYLFLYDFNQELLGEMCRWLDIDCRIEGTTTYVSEGETEVDDYRYSIHPKGDMGGDAHFQPLSYYQVFQGRWGFLPNLSVLDLLCNMGPEGRMVLLRSYK